MNEEQTLRDNAVSTSVNSPSTSERMPVLAHGRYRLRPRVLRGVSDFNMSTRLLGEEVMFPIGRLPLYASFP